MPEHSELTPNLEKLGQGHHSCFACGWKARDPEVKRLKEFIINGQDEAAIERDRFKSDLAKAIQYLREGKQKFSQETTNSFVDDLLKKYPQWEHEWMK